MDHWDLEKANLFLREIKLTHLARRTRGLCTSCLLVCDDINTTILEGVGSTIFKTHFETFKLQYTSAVKPLFGG